MRATRGPDLPRANLHSSLAGAPLVGKQSRSQLALLQCGEVREG